MANVKNLVLLSLIFGFSCYVFGQQDSSYIDNQIQDDKEGGWWTFNIDGGISFLQSDIKPRIGQGYAIGLSVEKNLSYSADQLLIPNLRWRINFASNSGLDTERFTGIEKQYSTQRF